MKFEIIEGKYKTNNSTPVTILSMDARGDYPVKGIIHHQDCDEISEWGSIDHLAKNPSLEDLMIDDKVLVRDNSNQEWAKRYFSGVGIDGRIMTFGDGSTSWSNDCGIVAWNEWLLFDENEDK